MTEARDNLIIETFILSKVNLEQWGKFINAFGDYVHELNQRAVTAPKDEMQVACGRAQQAITFYGEFASIDQLYTKIDQTRKRTNRG